MSLIPAEADSMMASAANGGGHKNAGDIDAFLSDSLFDRVEDGDPFDLIAAFARRDACGDHGPVFQHSLGVKRPLAACNALHHNPGIFIDQYAHNLTPYRSSIPSADFADFADENPSLRVA